LKRLKAFAFAGWCLMAATLVRAQATTGQAPNARHTTIQQVFRQVEQMLPPKPWMPASVGSVLQARDGVRTFEKSSSELRFDSDSRLFVSEESVVFLRETTRPAGSISRSAIEIRAGQADLDVTRSASGIESGFEFHIGETVGTTRPGRAGKAASRARRAGDGSSRIMVYDGEGEVTAAGKTMAVPAGMGLSVAVDGRTGGPEKLMPAPKALTPNESQTFDYSNPTFDWDSTPGALSYSVEVCRDPECGQLVDRATGIKKSRWTPRVLPIGVMYWRVSALSPSGLDGFLSPAMKFTIRTYWRRPVEQP
jgi:hypothetical protein